MTPSLHLASQIIIDKSKFSAPCEFGSSPTVKRSQLGLQSSTDSSSYYIDLDSRRESESDVARHGINDISEGDPFVRKMFSRSESNVGFFHFSQSVNLGYCMNARFIRHNGSEFSIWDTKKNLQPFRFFCWSWKSKWRDVIISRQSI